MLTRMDHSHSYHPLLCYASFNSFSFLSRAFILPYPEERADSGPPSEKAGSYSLLMLSVLPWLPNFDGYFNFSFGITGGYEIHFYSYPKFLESSAILTFNSWFSTAKCLIMFTDSWTLLLVLTWSWLIYSLLALLFLSCCFLHSSW